MKGIGASFPVALLVAATVGSSGCDQRPVATPTVPPGKVETPSGETGPVSASAQSTGAAGSSSLQVRLDPALVAGFQVQTVGSAMVADTLRVAGRVDFNEQSLARIGSTVTGRVIDLQASLGQRVRVGQTLATLNSAELSSAQLAYLKTVAQARLMATAAERAQQLFAADVIAQAELQRREHAAEVARAEQSGAADQLAVLGMTPAAIAELLASNAINSVKPVISRVAGTVVERSVAVGQVVQPADTLFTVADLSRVWVLANVPEQQATSVQIGQSTEIEVPSLGRTLSGRIVHVSAVVDPQSRTVLARCELDNAAGELKPAMLANLLIRTAGRQVMVIPAAAVVRENNRDHVYVQSAANVFALTPVDLGPPADGDLRPVIKGLEMGQKIVVNGAFHLNNERRKQELQ